MRSEAFAEEKISFISNESFFYFLFADRNTFPGVLSSGSQIL